MRENLFSEPVRRADYARVPPPEVAEIERGVYIINPATWTPPTMPIEEIKGSRLSSKSTLEATQGKILSQSPTSSR